MYISERLQQFYPFSEETLTAVEDAAERQNQRSFTELADEFSIDEAHVRTNISGRPIEYLHLQSENPASDATRVLFAPMANGLKQNIVMRAMRFVEADNPGHLFVVGNPAHVGNHYNLLSRQERTALAAGYFTPMAFPILEVLSQKGIQSVDALGYSLGATAAQGLVLAAPDYGIETDKAVFAEPANTLERTLPQLLKDFAASGAELDEYTAQANSAPLRDAIALARDDVRFFAGLARLSNIAIARGLAKNTFNIFNADILRDQPDTRIATVFAEHSTLAVPGFLDARIRRMDLKGAHHAAAEDIDLHAAIMSEGLAIVPR